MSFDGDYAVLPEHRRRGIARLLLERLVAEAQDVEPLRAALEDRGHTLRTDVDTEVIPHLWDERGQAFLDDAGLLLEGRQVVFQRLELALQRQKPLAAGQHGVVHDLADDLLRQRRWRNHTGRVARVNARFLDMLHHAANVQLCTVVDGVDIDLDGDLDIISIGWVQPRVLLYENKAIDRQPAAN